MARRIVGWDARDLASLAATLALAAALEVLIIRQFYMLPRLRDVPITLNLQGRILRVSPCLHLIPPAVMLVYVFSWMHLRRGLAVIPIKEPKPGKRRARKARPPGGFRTALAVRSVLHILVALIAGVLISLQLIYPAQVMRAVRLLYGSSPLFSAYIHGVRAILGSPPIKQLLHPLNHVAAGFYSSLEPYIKAVFFLDPMYKYVLTQNIIAWIPAAVSLSYGRS